MRAKSRWSWTNESGELCLQLAVSEAGEEISVRDSGPEDLLVALVPRHHGHLTSDILTEPDDLSELFLLIESQVGRGCPTEASLRPLHMAELEISDGQLGRLPADDVAPGPGLGLAGHPVGDLLVGEAAVPEVEVSDGSV